jgi:hypothetical protein
MTARKRSTGAHSSPKRATSASALRSPAPAAFGRLTMRAARPNGATGGATTTSTSHLKSR